MAARINRKIVLVKRPTGEVTPDCLKLVSEPAPEPKEGEALVRNLYLSLDPTQQGWMKYDTYMPAIPIGDVVRSGGVGEVIESRSPHYTKGQLVSGLVGWQEYAIADGGGRRMSPVPVGISPEDAVSAVRHHGPHRLLRPARRRQAEGGRDGRGVGGGGRDRVGRRARSRRSRAAARWASPAAPTSAAGSCASSATTPRWTTRARTSARRWRRPARRASTSTSTTWAARSSTPCCSSINRNARIALCGAISTYSEETPPPGPRNLMMLVMKHGHMEGFLVLDYVARFPEAIDAMSKWKAEGKLRSKVDVVDGIENTPSAFRRLFTGGNTGKLLVRVG